MLIDPKFLQKEICAVFDCRSQTFDRSDLSWKPVKFELETTVPELKKYRGINQYTDETEEFMSWQSSVSVSGIDQRRVGRILKAVESHFRDTFGLNISLIHIHNFNKNLLRKEAYNKIVSGASSVCSTLDKHPLDFEITNPILNDYGTWESSVIFNRKNPWSFHRSMVKVVEDILPFVALDIGDMFEIDYDIDANVYSGNYPEDFLFGD